MSETSASLLDQLRVRPDGDAWSRLVSLYTPLIRAWLLSHAPRGASDPGRRAWIDELLQELDGVRDVPA